MFPISDFADGGYRWVMVDGTFTRDTEGRYLYFSGAPTNTNVEWIYVDRLCLIPV